MSGLTPAKRRARAKSAVRNATGSSSMPRRKIHRNASYRRPRVYAKRPSVSFTVPKARGRGKRRIAFRAPKGFQKGETVTIMAKNRRRRRSRTASGRFRKLAANRRRKTTTAKRRPVRRRKARRVVRNARRVVRKRKSPVRRRRVVRNRRRKSPVRRRRVVRNRRRPVRRNRRRVVRNRRRPVRRSRRRRVRTCRRARRRRKTMRRVVRNRRRPVRRNRRRVVRNRRRPVRRNRRRVVRNRRRPVRRRKTTRRAASRRAPIRRNRRRNGISRSFRRNPSGVIMQWVKTGGFIAAGVISHKFFAGFLKNLLVAKQMTAEALPEVDAQADGTAPTKGLGFLPASMEPYAGIISGGIAAAAGVYLVSKTVKDSQTRQLVAGGMVASFLHTIIVDLLKKSAPGFAEQVSGLGASDANAVRLSAMYGMGGPTSIEPMYSQINGMGEYFSSGVNGLGEYFSSGVQGLGSPDYAAAGIGGYFSSGVSGL